MILVLAGTFFSCEKNNPLADLSDLQGQVPNVYMASLAPIAFPGTEIEFEIQYWSADDTFGEMGLNQRIDTVAKLSFDLSPASVDYTYTIDYSGRVMEEAPITTETHEFTDWTPDKYAYTFIQKYTPDNQLAKKEYKHTSTGIDDFVELLPDTLVTHLSTDLSKKLSKSQLQIILVDEHTLLTESELDGCYDSEGYYTDAGQTKIIDKLKQIHLNQIIGDEYSLVNQNEVMLRYKVANAQGLTGQSAGRIFLVQ